MKRKSLQEWIDIYEKKTGDRVVLDDISRHLFYLPERGFCQLSLDFKNSRLIVWEVCGDGKFWRDFSLMEADGQGLTSIRTTTTRNIKAYLRLFGGKDYKTTPLANMIFCSDQDGRSVACGHQNNEWVIDIYLDKNNYS